MFDITQLKKIRMRSNLTQKKFAKLSGVSQSLIAKIEAEKIDPTLSKVKKIEEALGKIGKEQEACAHDIMVENVIAIDPKASITKVIQVLHKNGISQVPVIDGKQVKGVIYESTLLEKSEDSNLPNLKAEDIMTHAPPIISHATTLSGVGSLLKFCPLVLVAKKGEILGVITKADLLKSLL